MTQSESKTTPEQPVSRGTLKVGEYHPSADLAMSYILSIPFDKLALLQESMASCAIEGNRCAEVCSETLSRILGNQPVSDRYLLGLAWFLKDINEEETSCNALD